MTLVADDLLDSPQAPAPDVETDPASLLRGRPDPRGQPGPLQPGEDARGALPLPRHADRHAVQHRRHRPGRSSLPPHAAAASSATAAPTTSGTACPPASPRQIRRRPILAGLLKGEQPRALKPLIKGRVRGLEHDTASAFRTSASPGLRRGNREGLRGRLRGRRRRGLLGVLPLTCRASSLLATRARRPSS
jgi:hypothetical protein